MPAAKLIHHEGKNKLSLKMCIEKYILRSNKENNSPRTGFIWGGSDHMAMDKSERKDGSKWKTATLKKKLMILDY
jgi:hypothetical protein